MLYLIYVEWYVFVTMNKIDFIILIVAVCDKDMSVDNQKRHHDSVTSDCTDTETNAIERQKLGDNTITLSSQDYNGACNLYIWYRLRTMSDQQEQELTQLMLTKCKLLDNNVDIKQYLHTIKQLSPVNLKYSNGNGWFYALLKSRWLVDYQRELDQFTSNKLLSMSDVELLELASILIRTDFTAAFSDFNDVNEVVYTLKHKLPSQGGLHRYYTLMHFGRFETKFGDECILPLLS